MDRVNGAGDVLGNLSPDQIKESIRFSSEEAISKIARVIDDSTYIYCMQLLPSAKRLQLKSAYLLAQQVALHEQHTSL